MMICDECKQGGIPVNSRHVMIVEIGHRDPVTTIDLCKGCEPIFKKKIEDLVRGIVRKKQ